MHVLKTNLFFIFFIVFKVLTAQEITDKQIKESVIKDINDERKTEVGNSEQKISDSQKTIELLEIQATELRRSHEKFENLALRIKALEEKNRGVKEKELALYTSNYQTAVVNLAFLETDLKPLSLFQSSRKFFNSLNNISNPMSYQGYEDWYKTFKSYIDKNKQKETKLAVLNNMLTVTSNLTKDAPLTGPIVGTLFDGITSFIGSLSKKKKELISESEKMLSVTMILGQYTSDIKLIENEWKEIDSSLAELQGLYTKYVAYNLNLINEPNRNYNSHFALETNGMKKLDYLNKLKEIAGKRVVSEQKNNPNKWKQTFYYEMEKVQAIKIRFGEITIRIKQNFDQYNDLISRYEKNELMTAHMKELKEKLNNLKKNFSDSFNSEDYISDANTMYSID